MEEKSRQYIIFSIDDNTFGLNVLNSKEIIKSREVTSVPDSPEYIEGIIDLRGELVPVVDLAKRLGFNKGKNTRLEKVIISTVDSTLLGINVSDVREIQRINVEEISKPPDITYKYNSEYIKGVARVEDELIVILNLRKIFSDQELARIGQLKV